MIITPVSKDSSILGNIVTTLAQIKLGGKANQPLVIPGTGILYVSFYVDPAKTQLLFSTSSVAAPSQFSVTGTNTLFTPTDAQINAATGISTTMSQPFYYVSVGDVGGSFSNAFSSGFGNGSIPSEVFDTHLVYRNIDNLAFQSVIVGSGKDPKFVTNENAAILVPCNQKVDNQDCNSDLAYVLPEYDLYLQLLIYNWSGLSEQARLQTYMQTSNMIRLALYLDPYRGGNCTLYDRNIEGTFCSELSPLPSKDVLKAKMKIRCAYYTTSVGY